MKKLFVAIRHGDIETVKEILAKKPALIACTAKQPPKKDDGQSPLQVAVKTGHFDISEYLLDAHADVNFMESTNCCNEWRAPVIHDAIIAAIMCSRWNANSQILYGGLQVFHTKEDSDRAYQVLKRIIEMGADVNAVDSYGHSCVDRACMQAKEILPSYNYITKELGTDRILTKELEEDLKRIFTLLYNSGANFNYINPMLKRSAREFYTEGPVSHFLKFD